METILWLQTTCGNRAVQRLLLRRGLARSHGPQLETARHPRLRQSLRRWFRWLAGSNA
ncbi:MAG: hypothetical protein V7638_4829 [Acidobacteriota bacterium]|jgi:hypothetical protein